jgi:hypothetical protein
MLVEHRQSCFNDPIGTDPVRSFAPVPASRTISIPRRLAMRKLYPMLAVAVVFAAASLLVKANPIKDVTVTGTAQCAKCALKETKGCQNVVVAKEDGKDVKYYVVHNDVAKKAHSSLGFCTAKPGEGPKVTVTGELKEEDNKKVITPTEIKAAE